MTTYQMVSLYTQEPIAKVANGKAVSTEDGDMASTFNRDVDDMGFEAAMDHWSRWMHFEPEGTVEKSAWQLRTDQTNEPAGVVVVENGSLAGYVGDNPPVGYQDGMDWGEWQQANRGYTVEKMDEEPEETPPHRPAAMVGEAVGAALVATGLISKADEEHRNLFGWAYVAVDKDGKTVIDKSGDFLDEPEELEKTGYSFVVKARAADLDHTNLKSATMIESMVFTPEKIEKMGIPPGIVPQLAWWVGFHFEDPKDWEIAKKRPSFSIHGTGTRKSVS
jgi:hypothetical protein